MKTESPDALFERFSAHAAPILAGGGRVAVGCSGGLDSTVLLDLLHRLQRLLPFALSAFHLHHGLSAHADAWQRHCQEKCEAWGVPFSCERADLAGRAEGGLEARARAARYAAYARLAVDIVALAHHRDDQVETVLYRLVRGAGVHGAAGMPRQRSLAPGKRLWRPLLEESRASLLAYARHRGLDWVEDESNAEDVYDRNYLRNRVIPALVERFPAASVSLLRAAAHFAEAAHLADALAQIDAGAGWEASRLSVTCLVPLDAARRRNLVRWFLARQGLRPDERQIDLLIDQCLNAREDATPCLRLGLREVRRYRGELWLAEYRQPSLPLPLAECRDGALPGWGGDLSWREDRAGLNPSLLSQLTVRPRAGGERLRLGVGRPLRPVKHLLQEAGIPPWLRDHWPMLWHGDELVAVAGIGVSAAWQVAGLWPSWRPNDWLDAPDRFEV